MKSEWYFSLVCVLCLMNTSVAQQRLEPVPYGDFEQWTTRNIKESAILGGNLTKVYVIAPEKTVAGAIPYDSKGVSPWASSNVLAVIKGITKTSTTVFPEKRDDGRCARLDTKLVKCEVFGVFDISVLASGTIYLGKAMEPIKNINNPYSKMDIGIPFTERPKALMLDYKTKISAERMITKATGMSTKQYSGDDYCDVSVYLQKRWEDSHGNIYAERIATARKFIDKSTNGWVNNHRIAINYGDISSAQWFKSYMGLRKDFCAENSNGKMVPITEVGWADANEKPTHIILFISSGCHGAYVGALGNSFWIDNVKFVY